MRIAVYCRVSTDEQEVENQLVQLREFAAKQGWTISREYVDRGESGAKADRAEFQAMFRDASQRKFDTLLFWALDRLTREGTLSTLQYLNRLEAYGVAYRSFTEYWLDSVGPFKDVVISLMATLAKQEREKISERTKAGLDRAKRQGKRLGRPNVRFDSRRVQELRASGATLEQIAKEFRCSVATASRRVHGVA